MTEQNKNAPDLFGQPWAITESGLEMVQSAADQAGAIEAILARQGDRPRDSELTQIREGVAVVEVIGPIFHYENIVTWITGFPSAEGLMQEIQAADSNPEVESIVLQIDSPGGQVGGISELSEFIQSGTQKPVVAYVGDMAASAAYWIASAAGEIVAANTAELGSIGVVFSMRRRQDNGLEIVSAVSPKKRPDPETDEGRRVIQERADAIAEVFVQAVMENRTLTREQATALQGNMAIATSAVDLGLADRIGSLEGLIAELTGNPKYGRSQMSLTYEQLKADHAELFEQVKEEGRAEIRPEVDATKNQAITDANSNMLALVGAVAGEEVAAQIQSAMDAGFSAEQVNKAKELFGAQPQPDEGQPVNDATQGVLEGIQAATPQPALPADGGGSPANFDAAIDGYMEKNECSKGKAIKAMASKYPELHKAWVDSHNK